MGAPDLKSITWKQDHIFGAFGTSLYKPDITRCNYSATIEGKKVTFYRAEGQASLEIPLWVIQAIAEQTK